MEGVFVYGIANYGKFCIGKCFTYCDNSVFLIMIMLIFKAMRLIFLAIIKF